MWLRYKTSRDRPNNFQGMEFIIYNSQALALKNLLPPVYALKTAQATAHEFREAPKSDGQMISEYLCTVASQKTLIQPDY